MARLLLIFSSAGLEGFFEETLERVQDRSAPQPANIDQVVARYLAVAPKYGLEFLARVEVGCQKPSRGSEAAELRAACSQLLGFRASVTTNHRQV